MAIAVGLSFIQPLEYGTTVRFLVIQKSVLGLDPYTAVKSSERVANNLAEIMYTTSFFNKVLESGYGIDQSYFKDDEEKRREQWADMLGTSVEGGTGLLTIEVYHPDRGQSLELLRQWQPCFRKRRGNMLAETCRLSLLMTHCRQNFQ